LDNLRWKLIPELGDVAEERKQVRVGSGKGYDKLAVVGPCSVITSIGLQLAVRAVAPGRYKYCLIS